MNIELLKDYKLNTRVLPKGSIVGVTNGLGEKLIDKGVAKQTDKTDAITATKKTVVKSEKKENKNVILQNNKSGEAPDTKIDK